MQTDNLDTVEAIDMYGALDNFDLIATNLFFPENDVFYYAQIISRSKDCPQFEFGRKTGGGGTNANRALRTYVFNNMDDYVRLKPEIVAFCKFFKARAYINPTARSHSRVAHLMMKEIADSILSDNVRTTWRVYGKAVGSPAARHPNFKNYWIVDVDTKDWNVRREMKEWIKEREPGKGYDEKVVLEVPTRNGYHLITTAFDRRDWPFKQPNKNGELVPVDIHTNNITPLYIPDFRSESLTASAEM